MTQAKEAIEAVSWQEKSEWFQQCLLRNYYNAETGIMNQWYPREYNVAGENFYYWWQAHVIDILVDGYERSGDPVYSMRIKELSQSLRAYNGGHSGIITMMIWNGRHWRCYVLIGLQDMKPI